MTFKYWLVFGVCFFANPVLACLVQDTDAYSGVGLAALDVDYDTEYLERLKNLKPEDTEQFKYDTTYMLDMLDQPSVRLQKLAEYAHKGSAVSSAKARLLFAEVDADRVLATHMIREKREESLEAGKEQIKKTIEMVEKRLKTKNKALLDAKKQLEKLCEESKSTLNRIVGNKSDLVTPDSKCNPSDEGSDAAQEIAPEMTALHDIYAEREKSPKKKLVLNQFTFSTDKKKIVEYLNSEPHTGFALDKICRETLGFSYITSTFYTALRKPRQRITMAFDPNDPKKAIGFIVEDRSGNKKSKVELICTLDGYRGLGSALMKRAEEGVQTVKLEAVPEAMDFYKKLGFHEKFIDVKGLSPMKKVSSEMEPRLKKFFEQEKRRLNENWPDYDSLDQARKHAFLVAYRETLFNYDSLGKGKVIPGTQAAGYFLEWAIHSERLDVLKILEKSGVNLLSPYRTPFSQEKLLLAEAAKEGRNIVLKHLFNQKPEAAFSPILSKDFDSFPKSTQKLVTDARLAGQKVILKKASSSKLLEAHAPTLKASEHAPGSFFIQETQNGKKMLIYIDDDPNGNPVTKHEELLGNSLEEALASTSPWKNGKLLFPCARNPKTQRLECD